MPGTEPRDAQAELATQLGMARSVAVTYNDPSMGRDTRCVADTLAERVLRIDHLLAVLGVPGAELHPEREG